MAQPVNILPTQLGNINNVGGYPIITAGAMTADIDSGPYNVNQFPSASFHIKFTGTPTGEFFIQGSNVPNPTVNDWVTIPFVDAAGAAVTLTTGGAAGEYLANASDLSFSSVRVIYDFTSGTGTANAWLTVKGA